MSFFSSPKITPPPPPPAPPPLPIPVDPQIRRTREQIRRRQAAAGGRQGTIKTSAQGLLDDDDQRIRKSLLGK